jgi:hypothetical protein
MKISSFLGWVCLLISWGFFLSDGTASMGGRFLNGMALGFFIYALLFERKK